MAEHNSYSEAAAEKARRVGGWRIDKTVPLALLLAIAGQAAGMVWWVSEEAAELHDQDRRVLRLETAAEDTARAIGAMAEHLASVDAKVDIMLGRVPAPHR